MNMIYYNKKQAARLSFEQKGKGGKMQPSSESISFIHDEPFAVGVVALIPIIGYFVLNWIGLAGGEFREPVWLITLVCLYWISMRAWGIPSSEISGTSWGSIA
ncbi:MAG: hypothetical protein D6681_21695, partial [Calditrichaeota bacterium]